MVRVLILNEAERVFSGKTMPDLMSFYSMHAMRAIIVFVGTAATAQTMRRASLRKLGNPDTDEESATQVKIRKLV